VINIVSIIRWREDKTRETYETPASRSNTETYEFSVNRLAMTLPAVPPGVGQWAESMGNLYSAAYRQQ
jgi:hypothetical protein